MLDRIKGSHVLACAPSNSAADLLCQRLLQHRDAREIYRLNASSRDYSQVPAAIKVGACPSRLLGMPRGHQASWHYLERAMPWGMRLRALPQSLWLFPALLQLGQGAGVLRVPWPG